MIRTLNGIELGPNSPARGLRGCRPEKAEQALGNNTIARLGGDVVSLSQTRQSMVEIGLPDTRYRLFSVAFWWEWKAEDGQFTTDQHAFLVREMQCGAVGGVGVHDDLVAFVQVLQSSQLARNPQLLFSHATELIGRWASKGFRRESSPRRRRR